MVGLIDGSLSTLAPIFGIVFYTHKPHAAFVAGLATAIGAGISMAYSEGLSDTGELTGRGTPFSRGAITGAGTFLGGILHTLPFLISSYHTAVVTAAVVVACELVGLAALRWRFFGTSFVRSLGHVTLAGAIVALVGALVGSTALGFGSGSASADGSGSSASAAGSGASSALRFGLVPLRARRSSASGRPPARRPRPRRPRPAGASSAAGDVATAQPRPSACAP